MSKELDKLQPAGVWKYFLEICKIPLKVWKVVKMHKFKLRKLKVKK